jgi:AcrR family transcriptional regulator
MRIRHGRARMKQSASNTAGHGAAPLAPARSNRRSDATIAAILAATEELVVSAGLERFSILDVCERADVSRGTFYRYFSSQDELLDVFSRYKHENFHRSMMEAVTPYSDPDARFKALVRYLEDYAVHGQAKPLLRAAPEYTLRLFLRIFHESMVRIQDVMGIVFDSWDQRFRMRVDRELVCEMLIRYVLSEQVVPHDRPHDSVQRLEGLILALVHGEKKIPNK